MILIGASLNEVLTSVTRLIEAHSEGMLCSIFLLDEDGLHLRYGGAANPPQADPAASDGGCLCPPVASSAPAPYRPEPRFLPDSPPHPHLPPSRLAPRPR